MPKTTSFSLPSDERQMQSWANLEFHRAFLADDIRNLAYKRALELAVQPGATVLDVGSGTGILSFLAARAGAERVLGVDWSSLVGPASAMARLNRLDDRVQFLRKDARTLHIGDHQFLQRPPDIIVHDLIGGLVWDEDAATVLTHIRQTVANADTTFLPASYSIFLVPISAPRRMELEKFWSAERYGLDFGPFLRVDLDSQPLISSATSIHLNNDHLYLSSPALAYDVAFGSDAIVPPPVNLAFTFERDGDLDGYLGYLVVDFGPGTVPIVAKPTEPNTNWGQFMLPSTASRQVKVGEKVKVRFCPARWSCEWSISEIFDP